MFTAYSFHMPLFLFVSGYFYSAKYENDFLGGLRKKIKAYVLPYFGWNLFYGALITVLITKHLYTGGMVFNLHTLFIEPWITGHQFGLNLAGWFALTLFVVFFMYVCIRMIVKRFIESEYVILAICLAVNLVSVFLAQRGYNQGLWLTITKAMFGLAFVHLGFLYRQKLEKYDNFNISVLLGILIAQICIIRFSEATIDFSMAFMNFPSPHLLVPILTSVTGTYLYLHIAKIITAWNSGRDRIINLIGQSTWSIMLHHIFGFWVLNYIFYKLQLPGFDAAKFKGWIWYQYLFLGEYSGVIYAIWAIAFSIGVGRLVDYSRHKLLKR